MPEIDHRIGERFVSPNRNEWRLTILTADSGDILTPPKVFVLFALFVGSPL
jgi:hypothetical protein